MDNELLRNIPQLSNEMQLSIMNRVKTGELTIENALKEAQRAIGERQRAEEEDSQYNFSIYKYNRYRWQKRILQIDFNTKMMCSIEKGIIKRQISFSSVKSCDDAMGTKFSVSFWGRHDYELEAASVEDKQKIMDLVHKIIHGNIYEVPVHTSIEVCKLAPVSESIREGQLYLQRGGLASLKWVKYMAQLRLSGMTLVPCGRRETADIDGPGPFGLPSSLPVVIHFSDGNGIVETPRSCDTFTMLTEKNEYLFRVPVMDQTKCIDVKKERDEWVQTINKLCLEWKRRSQADSLSIYEVIQEPAGQMSSGEGGFLGRKRSEDKARGPVEDGGKGWAEDAVQSGCYDDGLLSPLALIIPKPAGFVPHFGKLPPPPPPLPPPLLSSKFSRTPLSRRTKAFHWDLVPQEKMGKSVWAQCRSKVRIDTVQLYEQFAVQEMGCLGGLESSNNVHIILNDKIAHNFNIFLISFPVMPGELKDRLCIVSEEDGGLTNEQIASLRRYVPSPGDIEMYKSYKGQLSELHVVDQYMMEMCNIPYLGARLDLLRTLRELPVSMEGLQPLINQKIRMCNQLSSCKSFVSVLDYLLAVGNYLNENAGKEKVEGFRLSSLTKLSQLRGKSRKFTLLHALVEQIMLHEPHLATFSLELTEFEIVLGASIEGLIAEVNVLKNELQKVVQYKKAQKVKNQGPQQQKFSKDLKMAIERYSADLSQLAKNSEEMTKLYADILVTFGEPPEQDSQEFFGWVCAFTANFKRVHAEMKL